MQKIEAVVRITKDHCPPQEQTIFEWFDLMRNPTNALRSPGLEINLEHHRVFKHGTEVYMSRYEYWCCTIKVDIGNSKGQYEKDKQEVTKDGSESTKIQHGI